MAKSNYGYMAKIGVDTSALEKGLAEINSQLRETQSQLNDTENAIKAAEKAGSDNTQAYAQKQELLQSVIDENVDKLTQLLSVKDKVTEAFNNDAVDYKDFTAFNNEITQTQANIAKYTQQLEQLKGTQSDTSALQEYIKELTSADTTYEQLSEHIKALETLYKNGDASLEQQNELYSSYSKAIEEACSKLADLVDKEKEVNAAFSQGLITSDEFNAFNREIANTSNQITQFENKLTNLDAKSGFNDMEESADKAGESVLNLGDLIKGNLASDAIKFAIKAVVDTLKELGQELENIVVDAGRMGNTIDKQSQRLSMTQEAYQEWSYILSQNGADISTLTMGMRTLTNKLDDLKKGTAASTKAFAQLGLTYKDLEGLTGEQAFSKVIEQLQGIEDTTERNALANDILGRSYMQLIPLLNQSSDSVELLRQRAHDTNQLMSEEGVRAAVNYTDAVDTLSRSFQGFKNDIGAEILPGINDIINGLTDLINNVEGAEDKILRGVDSVMTHLDDVVPRVGNFIGRIITVAGDKAPDIIKKITTSIDDHLPEILDAFGDLAKTVGQAITAALPEIGESATNIVLTIFGKIVENLTDQEKVEELLTGFGKLGYSLCSGVADGIVNYEWDDLAVTFVSNLAKVLDPARRAFQVWIDDVDTAIRNELDLWMGNGYGDPNAPTLIEAVFGQGYGDFYQHDPNKTGENYLMSDDFKNKVKQDFEDYRNTYKQGKEELDKIIYGDTEKDVKKRTEAENRRTEAEKNNTKAMETTLQEKVDRIKSKLNKGAAEIEETGESAEDRIKKAYNSFKTSVEYEVAQGQMTEDEANEQLGRWLEKNVDSNSDFYKEKYTEYLEKRKSLDDDFVKEQKKLYDQAVKEQAEQIDKQFKIFEDLAKIQGWDDRKLWQMKLDYLENYRNNGFIYIENEERYYEQLRHADADIRKKDREEREAQAKKNAEEEKRLLENQTKERETILSRAEAEAEKILNDFYTNSRANILNANRNMKTVTDIHGEERLVFTNYREKLKEIKTYQANLKKLKDMGLSAEHLQEIFSMDFSTRAKYISELVRMGASNRAMYLKDWESYHKQAGKTATMEAELRGDEIGTQLQKAYDNMGDSAYISGKDAAYRYKKGLEDGFKGTALEGILDFDKLIPSISTASDQYGIKAVVDTANGLIGFANSLLATQVNVVIDNKKAAAASIAELLRKVQNSGSKGV